MKRTIIGFLGVLLLASGLTAQEGARFTVEVSTDSVLLGNYFQLSFTLEHAVARDFTGPDLGGQFDLVSGPNQASSMQVFNGQVRRSTRYTYVLQPRDIGSSFIGPASIETAEGQVLETTPLEIFVLPNPDGRKQPLNGREGIPGMGHEFMQQFEFAIPESLDDFMAPGGEGLQFGFGLPPGFEQFFSAPDSLRGQGWMGFPDFGQFFSNPGSMEPFRFSFPPGFEHFFSFPDSLMQQWPPEMAPAGKKKRKTFKI